MFIYFFVHHVFVAGTWRDMYIYIYTYRYRYLDGQGVLDTSFVASCSYPTCISAQRTSAPEFLFSGPDPGCGNVCLQTVLKDKNDLHPKCDEPAGYTLSPMNLTFQSCPGRTSIAIWLARPTLRGVMCPCITLVHLISCQRRELSLCCILVSAGSHYSIASLKFLHRHSLPP